MAWGEEGAPTRDLLPGAVRPSVWEGLLRRLLSTPAPTHPRFAAEPGRLGLPWLLLPWASLLGGACGLLAGTRSD